jgi:hypothetical protein
MTRTARWIPAVGLLLAATALAQDSAQLTPNAFYGRGKPTFVVGTTGDDAPDRKVRAQVEMVRGMLFPDAKVVPDTAIDVAKGPTAWPPNPVLYGGPHVNQVVAALAADLPFRLGPGKLELGDAKFEGDEYRLIAAIPAGKRHPDLLLYAGTGTPGVAEINGTSHGPHPFVVGDRFGPLVAGIWTTVKGRLTPRLGRRARRLAWRHTAREAAGVKVSIGRLEMVGRRESDAAVDAACVRGFELAAKRLELEDPGSLTFHVYPDRGSKRSLTGNGGDGNADVLSCTLHLLPFDAKPGGPLETLAAHEATHVLAYYDWGPAGTPLLGEGLAVWVSDSYGGRKLEDWRRAPPARNIPVSRLMGPDFRRMPERTTYPLAGILTAVLVGEVGLDALRDHLYPASPASWSDACSKAGTTAEKVRKAFVKALSGS